MGAGDGMPWNVPDEYRQFLDFVDGQTVLMGRRSWEIFGKDLTSAHNVVVSRSAGNLAGAEVVGDLETAIEVARGHGKRVFSAGGAQIYRQTLPLADAMYLSFIKKPDGGDWAGDAFFPEWDAAEWRIARREDLPAFEFVEYQRVRKP